MALLPTAGKPTLPDTPGTALSGARVFPTRRIPALAAIGVTLVVAACQPAVGGGGSAPPSAAVTSAPAPTGTRSTAPTPTPTAPAPTTSAAPATTAPASPTPPASSPSTAPAAPTTQPAPSVTSVQPGRIRPGVTYTGPATSYGADGGGNCLFDPGADPSASYAALNEADYEGSRMCGAYIEVVGPRGTTTVKIVDRCPECGPGHVDLSREAFARIADPVAGIVPVSWRLVSPASIGNVQYKIKDGSSQYWLAIQVRNHRNPVVSLEVLVGGAWRALPREMYNYFIVQNGLGPGPFTIRVTDIYGEQLVHSGITLLPTAVQTTSSQFAQH